MKTDYFEFITRYMNDQLDDHEREDFEAEMARDPELRKTVENYPALMEILEVALDRKAKTTWQKFKSNGTVSNDTGIPSNPAKIYPMVSWRRAAIAAILILLIGAYPVWNTFYKQSPQRLYAHYYESYPNLESGTRSGPGLSDIESQRLEVYSAYGAGAYELVIQLLQQMPEDYETVGIDAFFLGISYLELDRTEEAIAKFQQTIAANTIYTSAAHYYEGLSYLKSGECEKAKTTFRSIRETALDYAQESKQILRRLKCK